MIKFLIKIFCKHRVIEAEGKFIPQVRILGSWEGIDTDGWTWIKVPHQIQWCSHPNEVLALKRLTEYIQPRKDMAARKKATHTVRVVAYVTKS